MVIKKLQRRILRFLGNRAVAAGRFIIQNRLARWIARRRAVRFAARILILFGELFTLRVWRPGKRLVRRILRFMGRHEILPWVLTWAACFGLAKAILKSAFFVKLVAGGMAASGFVLISFLSPLAGLLIWLLLSPLLNALISFHFLPGTPVVTGDKICLVVLLVIYVVHMKREFRSEPNAPLHAAMFLFLGAMLLSAASARGVLPRRAIQGVLECYGAPILVYFLARRWISDRTALRWAFVVMLITSVYFCGFAIPEHFTGRNYFTRSGRSAWIEEDLGAARVQGPAESPQEFGLVVATAMVLAVVLFSLESKAGRRFIYFCILALGGVAVSLTLRRSVYVSAFLGLAAMLVSGGKVRRNVAIILAAGALATIISWQQLSTSKFYSERIVSIGPLYNRAIVQATAWNVFKHYPVFGIGAGNFADVAGEYLIPYKNIPASYGRGIKSPHNSYLRIMVEGGSVAFVPFLAMLLLMMHTSIQAYKRASGPGLFGRDGVVVFWGLSIGLLIQAMSTDSFHFSRYLITFWFFFLGAIAGMHLQPQVAQSDRAESVPAKLQVSVSPGIIGKEGKSTAVRPTTG